MFPINRTKEMNAALLIIQCLNGLQLGVLLFLMAAGLTLVFGIMNFINLAHGSLYMLGAFIAASVYNWTGSFILAAISVVPAMIFTGVAVEFVALKKLYGREPLDQVLATFGLIIFFNELVRWIWGASPYYMEVPEALSGTINLFGIQYPAYRFVIIVVGLAVAVGCYLLIHKSRIGMLIRAGSTDRAMVSALGVNIVRLNTMLFALGAVLAGLAGLMAGPILSVQPGMGEPVLILTLVVIVIGGIGSVRGAFLAALIVGVVDTAGRTVLPTILRMFLERSTADTAGPALASMLIYLVMAFVLALRPEGLFPARHG
jgi:branched-chain amino acid transport system permease protein